jgi:transcriptional regulator CtsR
MVKGGGRVTLAEMIEEHLLRLVEEAGEFEIKRSDLAAKFRCVPSQITYVLDTRFTPERGYLVESRRGEGGYIRIKRLGSPSIVEMLAAVQARDGVDQRWAEAVLDRLYLRGLVTSRERALMKSVLDRETLRLPLPERDHLRRRLLRAMLIALAAEGGVAADAL